MEENIFNIPVGYILGCLAIFLRVSGVLFALPVFGDDIVPLRVRTLLSISLTMMVIPMVPKMWDPNSISSIFELASVVLRELLIGLSIGYVAKLLFDAVVMAAGLVGYQMGFGTAELLMPDLGQPVSAFTHFHRNLMILFFLVLDFHHIYLKTMVESFRMIPIGKASLSPFLGMEFVKASGVVFASSVELAAPILVALLFTMTALGLLARAVPQVNVFIISFPIGFAVGLLVYVATIPLFPSWMQEHFSLNSELIVTTLTGLKPL